MKSTHPTTRLRKAKKACVGAAQDSYLGPRDPARITDVDIREHAKIWCGGGSKPAQMTQFSWSEVL